MSKTLAGRIRAAREAAGLNQSELSRALKVSPQTVQQWEKGGGVRHKNLQDLARVLGVTAESLLFGADPSQNHHNVAELPKPSHTPALTATILAAALDWLDFEEGPHRRFAYQGEARSQRLLALCELVASDGGRLSPEHARELIAAAEYRFQRLEKSRHVRSPVRPASSEH